jgi:hypothetical protein
MSCDCFRRFGSSFPARFRDARGSEDVRFLSVSRLFPFVSCFTAIGEETGNKRAEGIAAAQSQSAIMSQRNLQLSDRSRRRAILMISSGYASCWSGSPIQLRTRMPKPAIHEERPRSAEFLKFACFARSRWQCTTGCSGEIA